MQRIDLYEIGVVYRKDLLELFRDYRSLIVMVVMPILIYPLFLVLPAIVATKIKSDIMERNSRVAITGDFAPLVQKLQAERSLTISDEHHPEKCMTLLREGKVDLVVRFPEDFSKSFQNVEKVPVISLIFNQRKELSLVSAQHFSNLLADIKEQILKKRTLKHDFELPTQYNLETESVEVKSKEILVSDPIRNVVPFLLFTMVLVAISYPAIDIITGERERKSLPLLLLSPVARKNIMLGKLLVISTCGISTVALGLISILVTFTAFSGAQKEFDFTFSPLAAVYCFLTSIPLVISLSALAIYLASWCKTFQQGQGYFVPFLLFVLAGTGVCSMPQLELSSGVAFIPILNTALGIKEFLSGSPNWSWQAVTVIVSVIFASMVTMGASRILDREDLMFDLDKPKEARWKEKDYAVEVGLLVTSAFLLMFYLGQSLQQWDMSYGSILTQLIVILAPSLVLLRFVGRLNTETLSLVKPRFSHLLAAALLSPACIYLAFVVSYLQNFVFPAPEVFTTIFTKLIVQADKPLVVVIAALALAPAICEELMFRGAILGLVRDRFGKWGSVLFVGILFGLFHLSIFRIFPTAVLGFVLTAITVFSGSIYPAMLIHFLNNATAIYITRNSLEDSVGGIWPLALLSGLLGMIIFFKFARPEVDKAKISKTEIT